MLFNFVANRIVDPVIPWQVPRGKDSAAAAAAAAFGHERNHQFSSAIIETYTHDCFMNRRDDAFTWRKRVEQSVSGSFIIVNCLCPLPTNRTNFQSRPYS
jgi:hypothetical protein